jgi:hypothetical protein
MSKNKLSFFEERAKQMEEYDSFSGLKLTHIKRKLAELLGFIGKGEIFDQYTKHDISHIDQLLEIAEWLVPEGTKEKLTSADCLMIVLSIYFHDLGMLVTKAEYSSRQKSGFKKYKEEALSGEFGTGYKNKLEKLYLNDRGTAEKFLYQEFIRNTHAERVKYWVEGKQIDNLGISNEIVDELNGLLEDLPYKFRLDLGNVCESHHLTDLDDFSKYKTSVPYGRSDDEVANIHYAAIVLRTADLLHMTSDRTPTIEYRIIAPSDPISQIEWMKQMAVSNVRGQVKKNKEGFLDEKITKDTIEVTAFFDKADKAEAFFSLMTYLKYSRAEIKRSFEWAEIANKEQGVLHYSFPWKDIDDSNVQTHGFERELFEFVLDQNKILNLLVGHTLYNDSSVVLRELIQNSIDAIRLYSYQKKSKTEKEEINVLYDSQQKKLRIIDTGTGMDRNLVKNHLLKVGSSRYQDEKFQEQFPDFVPISRFGIGILTCFLVSDDVEVSTTTEDDIEALNLSIRNVDGKYLLRTIPKNALPSPIKSHGTCIELKIRDEIEINNLVSDIQKWILYPSCKLSVQVDEDTKVSIGYDSPKEALTNYLTLLDFDVDDKNVKVEEKHCDGVTVAFALEYIKLLNEWRLIEVSKLNPSNDYKLIQSPIGTAVQGIRVEFNTPGFDNTHLFAAANVSGKSAPTTNVARSSIETGGWIKNVYSIYSNYIQDEINSLLNKYDYSLTWSVNEISSLLEPILNAKEERFHPDEDYAELIKPDLFYESLFNVNGVLIEKDQKRTALSIRSLESIDELRTIDCDLFRSGEDMLKEISSETSVTKLISVLHNGDTIVDDDVNILCGYSPSNILHENSLRNREVTAIELRKNMRRVDLIWSIKSKEKSTWFYVSEKIVSYSIGRSMKVAIQKENVKVEGINNEIAILSFGTLYILEGSKFHSLLLDLNDKLSSMPYYNDYAQNIFSIVLNWGYSRLKSHYTLNWGGEVEQEIERNLRNQFDPFYDRSYSEEELIEFFWKIIDKSKLVDCMRSTEWNMFDTSAWFNRKTNFDY